MSQNSKRTQFLVWGLLLGVILVIIGVFVVSKQEDWSGKPPFIYSQVGDFALTNQFNEPVSLRSLHGQIWFADVIFTRCPLQCIRMTKRMRELQLALPLDGSVKMVSITADPRFDTPEVLKDYAQQYGADQKQWIFLTGAKSEINRLVVTGLKLVVYEKKPEEREVPADLFLHSTKFVLVDGQGRIRGWFDADKPESKSEMALAVKMLLKEKK